MSGDHPSHGTHHAHERRRVYGWVVTLDVTGVVDVDLAGPASDLGDMLQPYSGGVSFDADGTRYGASFSITQPDLDAAVALAFGVELFRSLAAHAGLPCWPIVHAEVTRVTEHGHLRLVR